MIHQTMVTTIAVYAGLFFMVCALYLLVSYLLVKRDNVRIEGQLVRRRLELQIEKLEEHFSE